MMKFSILITDTTGEKGVTEINGNGFAIIAQTDDGYKVAFDNVSVMDITKAFQSDKHFMQAACLTVGNALAQEFGKKIEMKETIEKFFKGNDD
jgi:hypothetical protein